MLCSNVIHYATNIDTYSLLQIILLIIQVYGIQILCFNLICWINVYIFNLNNHQALIEISVVTNGEACLQYNPQYISIIQQNYYY